MANALQRFLDLIPKSPEFIGTITFADHPNYKVLVVDSSGVVICTSSARYNLGDRVFIANNEIKRIAPAGDVIQIEV